MAPVDLQLLMTYIVGLIGTILDSVGSAFAAGAANGQGEMLLLTNGIFGENGGLIYWCNQKLLWLLEQILAGLSFTSPL